MNKEKVYIEGYEVDTRVSPLGYLEKKIQLMNGGFVIVDENFIHKSIEPQKVKVPQFVADWIERSKQEKRNLRNALNNGGEKMRLWFLDQENYDLFARAWLDGYEVEKEKRYYVRFKWIEEAYSYLTFIKRFDAWTLKNITLDKKFRIAHTRKQLEDADFGWVFDCPGIEIEEVE